MPYKDRAAQLAYFRANNQTPKEQERRRRERHYWDSAKHANQRAAKYGVDGLLKTGDVRLIFERDNNTCQYCLNADAKSLGLDHVIPLSGGGSNTVENIVLCCGSCNARKSKKASPQAWSARHSACIVCGETTSRHVSYGRCSRCYQRINKRDALVAVLTERRSVVAP